MEEVHILELPYEVLYQILYKVECDLYKECYNLKWDHRFGLMPYKKESHAWQHEYYKIPGDKKVFDNLPIRHGPISISILSAVCIDFYHIAQTLWRPCYILHFRKNVPMKRKYTDLQYRKKYMDYIKKIYKERVSFCEDKLKYYSKMYQIHNNNLRRCLENKIIERDGFPNKNHVYHISDIHRISGMHNDYIEKITIQLDSLERFMRFKNHTLKEYKYFESYMSKYNEKNKYLKSKLDIIC